MPDAKDSVEVIEFMRVFQKLRDRINDEPAELERLATEDESIWKLASALYWAAEALSTNERRQRRMFAAPVDPKFIEAWRNYEDRYERGVGAFALDISGFDDTVSDRADCEKVEASPADIRWESADEDAKEQAAAIKEVICLAAEEVSYEWRDFADGHRELVENGLEAWGRLKQEVGFDLRGVFRRHALVPFVLIPRDVSHHHGEVEHISLLTHLQQAHEAFVLGVPFAALALMRSILETTLRKHYQAEGRNLAAMVADCEELLPPGASVAALHRLRELANDVLHLNREKIKLPLDFEKELLFFLRVLRALIEGAPARPS